LAYVLVIYEFYNIEVENEIDHRERKIYEIKLN